MSGSFKGLGLGLRMLEVFVLWVRGLGTTFEFYC